MKDNGGPAFPFTWEGENGPCAESGMSLRDHFAGLAMQGWLSNPTATPVEADMGEEATPDDMAEVAALFAYKVADAMIAERRRER